MFIQLYKLYIIIKQWFIINNFFIFNVYGNMNIISKFHFNITTDASRKLENLYEKTRFFLN